MSEEDKKEESQSLLLTTGTKPQDIIEMAKNAEQWVTAMQKIKAAVLKLTHSGDWVDQDGKPYLQSSGAEKLAGPFGVKSKFIYEGGQPKVSAWKESESGGHYAYRIPMTVSIGNCSIDVVGKRSSSDAFFTTHYGYENGERKKLERSAEEVDENNIIGSAISNGLANGISRILGLRNLTWEELNAAGIQAKTKVAYNGKREPSTAKPEKEGDQTISENQSKRFYAMAKGKNIPEANWRAYLFDIMK